MTHEWKSRSRDRLIQEHDHDTYKSKRKLPEPTVCPECKAVFHQGRWTWAPRPPDAHETLCPACHRVHDRYPAGYVTLSGGFLRDHSEELLGLVRHVEAREKAEHPLKRIMDIVEEHGGTVITTTDIHLARSIGDALVHAYEGKLDYRYAEESNILHVTWER
jgi:NMD protein affecting ribosome stability and mRNA decay